MNASLSRSLRSLAFSMLTCVAGTPLLAAPSVVPETPSPAALPADSVYQLGVPLTDQQGRTTQLVDRRGHPVLIGMVRMESCVSVPRAPRRQPARSNNVARSE